MGTNRPVITVQCGNYSNYLGAHYWNLQEAGFVYGEGPGDHLEVDNDVLYREGRTLAGEVTYTPRLVAMDLQGSLGLLPVAGDLYGRPAIPSTESVAWEPGCQVFKEEPHKQNDFLRGLDREARDETMEKDIDISMDKEEGEGEALYNLDNQVDYWSDYLGARFHPRSCLLVTSYQHGNTTHPFDAWGLGREVWSGWAGVGEELEERVRGFAEECDALGGLQLLADWSGGWGGLAGRAVELLGDEYPGRPLLAFPTAPATHPTYTLEQGLLRLAGAALTLHACLPAALTSPLSLARDWLPLAGRATPLPHLPYTPSLPYHSSAVLALALDSATLPFRRRPGALGASLSPAELAAGLATRGRRVAAVSTDLPVSMDHTKPAEYLEADLVGHTTPLLPGTGGAVAAPSPSDLPYCALLTLRGLQTAPLYTKRSAKFSPCPSAAAYLASCVNSARRSARPVAAYLFTRPAPTTAPFPHIFGPAVEEFGTVGGGRPEGRGVTFTTQLTAWAAGPTAGTAVAGLAAQAGRLQLGKVHRLVESGVEGEEWEEALEGLRQLADSYTEDELL